MSNRGKLLVKMAQNMAKNDQNDSDDSANPDDLTVLENISWTLQQEHIFPEQTCLSVVNELSCLDNIPIFTEDGIVLGQIKKKYSNVIIHQDVMLSSKADGKVFTKEIEKAGSTANTETFIKLDQSFSLRPNKNDNNIQITFYNEDNLNLMAVDKENASNVGKEKQKILPAEEHQEIEVNETEVKEIEGNIQPSLAEIEDLEDANFQEADQGVTQYTKKGEKRKRKAITETLESRRIKKKNEIKNKHMLKPPCNENKCKKKCITKISEERRQEINSMYWQLNWTEQKSFVLHSISRNLVKRRTLPSGDEESARKNTFIYYFSDKNGQKQDLCKIFFLTTLGYHLKNDWIIQGFVRQEVFKTTTPLQPKQDGRGRSASKAKIPTDRMEKHIESFNPTISHYRREHAPNRMYLPSDLTIESMHIDYLKKEPFNKCSYEVYRKVVKNKNISFTALGHEECEQCETFKLHNNQHKPENLGIDCDICKTWRNHINRAEEARNLYRIDTQDLNSPNTVKVSVDLQKVIMLPRLEMFKKVIFTQRISVYNESFVPLGKVTKQKAFACLWHEGIAGRAKEEIISTFYAFFLHYRDTENFVIWVDNCSGQNENWAFLTFLIYIVNSDEVAAKDIRIKYFEPGHTFMSADSFHHQVELSLKKQKKTYDFNDFVKAVGNSNSKRVIVREMEAKDFYQWQDSASQVKIKNMNPRPYLSNITQIIATRGNDSLQYKIINDSDNTLYQMDFLQNKIKKTTMKPPKQGSLLCGISKEKKQNIIKNLEGIIPANRMQFWRNLPTCK